MDDLALQHAVAEELESTPHLDAERVTVNVRGGIAQLTGFVGSLAEKKAVERAVWHVRGVRGIAEDLEVVVPERQQRADEDIARHVISMLDRDTRIPSERIRVKVEHSMVTLLGTVDWQFQRIEAEGLVHGLAGVVGVNNQITICPLLTPPDIEANVERAFQGVCAQTREIF